MFTGLVERTGLIKDIKKPTDHESVWTLVVDPGTDYLREYGASVAINGVCLTEVGHVSEGPLTFHVSHETLAKSSLGQLVVGDLVNLERAMRPTDRLGGHMVLGHVDGTATVTKVEPAAGFYTLEIKMPIALGRYVVSKGSIALNGVSLTVNHLKDDGPFTYADFMLIPVTWNTTAFHRCTAGHLINIEVDIIAKHIERLVGPYMNRIRDT